MSAKIGNKSVNKIMIGNKEVLKIIQTAQGFFEVNINTLYTKPNTDFMVNVADTRLELTGTTGTNASGGALLDGGKWDQAFYPAQQSIMNENYSISGDYYRPYAMQAVNAKYYILNKIQLRNATTTSRNSTKIQIYDSNNNLVYDSQTYSKSVNLPSNTSSYVTLDLGTSLKLNYTQNTNVQYRVLAYTGTTTKTYRNAYVYLYDYDVAPGLVS